MATARGAMLLAAIAAILPGSPANSCCPDGGVLERPNKTCDPLDGGERTYWKLNCTRGVYILDPVVDLEDTFTVMENGELKTGKGDTFFYFPPHAYCVSRMKRKNSSLPTEHEVAFICFADEMEGSLVESDLWRILYGTLQAISAFLLFVTLTIYGLIPELRDLQGRCIMSTVLCQLIGFLTLSCLQFMGQHVHLSGCIVSAFFVYFWMLASFFWLSVNSFNVWRSVKIKSFPLDDRQLFWCYCAFGWLCPLTFLGAALATHHIPESLADILRPNFGISQCWFEDDLETWVYFYGPISALLVCNVLFFVITVITLWRRGSEGNVVPGNRASRYKCLLYLKLCVVMGVPWIFEVLSFMHKGELGYWRITDIVNNLSGLLIFLVVVCRRRVIQALAKRDWSRKIVCALCPRRCTSGPDAEQEAPMLGSAADYDTNLPMDSATKDRT